jgi:hypothetical protein
MLFETTGIDLKGEGSSSTEPGLKRQTKKGGLLYETQKSL